MRNLTLSICVAFLSVTAKAQLTEKIETDRPDQTESPYTVPKKWFQSETGFVIENDKSGNKAFAHPTMLNKYGLSKRFELRLITEFISFQTPVIIPQGNDIVTGLQPIEIGGKLALLEEKKPRPKISLIFHTAIPKAASKQFQQTNWAPNFRFTMQNSLSEFISLGYNLGMEWYGEEETKPSFIYTFAPGFTLSEKWYAYLEVFGFLNPDNHPQHSVDGGIAYNFSNNTKIDLSGGFGITKNTSLKNYVALGFSFRLPVEKY
jgi:hypothetical protein